MCVFTLLFRPMAAKGVRFPWSWSCKQLVLTRLLRTGLSPIQEQHTILTTDPSLQPWKMWVAFKFTVEWNLNWQSQWKCDRIFFCWRNSSYERNCVFCKLPAERQATQNLALLMTIIKWIYLNWPWSKVVIALMKRRNGGYIDTLDTYGQGTTHRAQKKDSYKRNGHQAIGRDKIFWNIDLEPSS